MKYNLNLNDRAFNAIINGTKKIEIRANTKKHNYANFNSGDFICFTNSSNEIITCKIIEINHYNTVEELLTLEGTRYTTSSTDDYKEAVERIYSLNGYKEEIPKSGVYAIHIQYLYKNTDIWNELFTKAKIVLKPKNISNSVDAGGVVAAVLSKDGNIYTGVCIDMACSIGMCAERNALSTMITNGESKIDKLVCIGSHNNIMMPCGLCCEFMMQLDNENKNMEILTNIDTKEIVTLKELLSNWRN